MENNDKKKIDAMFEKYRESSTFVIDVVKSNYYDGEEGRLIIECPAEACTIRPAGELLNIGGLSDGYHTFDEL